MEYNDISKHIIYRREFFIKAMLYLLLCFSFGLIFTYIVKSRIASIVILVIIIAPLVLFNVVLKLFVKKISLNLSPKQISITFLEKDKDSTKSFIKMDEIQGYSVQFPNENFSTIKFFMDNQKSKEYSFFQKKNLDDSMSSEDLINIFHKIIMDYNQYANQKKIKYMPSFYASKKGLFTIVGLTVFLLLTVALISTFSSKGLSVTFIFSFLLIIQLIFKRKKELEYYNTQLAKINFNQEDQPG